MEIDNQIGTEDLRALPLGQGYEAIPMMENIAGHLLIEVRLNNTPGKYIVDTGAATTVVEILKAEDLHLFHEKEDISYTGAGAGGQGLQVCPSSGNTIEVGNFIRKDFTVTLMSLEHVNGSLSTLGAQEEITGIIGVDILKSAKAVIDYDKMILYLSMNP